MGGRGPRLTAHLATRERPGEVVAVSGVLGCLGLPFALGSLVIVGAVLGGKMPPTALAFPSQVAFLAFCLLALWRGARWAWTLTMVTLGSFTLFAGLGAGLAGFKGSLEGAVLFGVMGGLGAAMLLALGKARRRYRAWAESDRNPPSPPTLPHTRRKASPGVAGDDTDLSA